MFFENCVILSVNSLLLDVDPDPIMCYDRLKIFYGFLSHWPL